MSNLLVQNIKHTNGTTAQTIDSSGNTTVSGTLGSGAITSTGAVQGTQFNVGGLKILEEAEFTFGDGSANKAVATTYDYTFSLAAGTWLPFVKCHGSFFENHGNSNSTGLYYVMNKIETSSGAEDIANEWIIVPKWGNATNSYSTLCTSVAKGKFTIGSTTTLLASWRCNEYGTSSNYWVRNGGFGAIFYRIG